MYDDLERPQNIGHLFGVLPVASFEDVAAYRTRMDKAVREVRGVKPAPGVARIYLPGEREYLLLEERRRSGIPIGTGVFGELQALGREYGVELKA
jgi:LDH2 family malate/lactate/ureidoglycolate dehydrogenase